jgi:hypothetical protein
VRGDAGIGKSRLVDELRQIALAEGIACHTGLVLDFGTAKGRDAIREIVASLVGCRPGSDGTSAAKADATIASTPRLPTSSSCSICSSCRNPRRAVRSTRRWTMWRARVRSPDAVVRMLQAACAKTPALLVIEDYPLGGQGHARLSRGAASATAAMPAVLALTSRRGPILAIVHGAFGAGQRAHHDRSRRSAQGIRSRW